MAFSWAAYYVKELSYCFIWPMSERYVSGKSVHSWCDGLSDRSFMVDPLTYYSFQPVLHDWCNKDHSICYPVYGIMHIKEPLLLIRESSPCSGSSGFLLSLSEWSFTICPTPYCHISHSIQCSTTGIPKSVVYVIML